jgi:ABC-2 type transport system permease protein
MFSSASSKEAEMVANENVQVHAGNNQMVLVQGSGRMRGLNNLLSGELTQWFRTRRWWVNILIWAGAINFIYLMVALNSRTTPIIDAISVFNVFMGLAGPIGTVIIMQMVVVGETRSGTASWIMSKPVARQAFILSKLIGNTIGLAVTMILAQGVIAYLITGLVLNTWLSIPGFTAGMLVHLVDIFFYLTLTLMLGTVFDHPAPVIGIPLAFLFAQQYLGAISPVVYQLIPWTLAVPVGDSSPALAQVLMNGLTVPTYMPLISALVFSAVFTLLAVWVFQRKEL